MPKRPRQKSRPDLPVPPTAEVAARVVGIGASAGGLEAFTQLVGALPLDAGFAYVLVQHLDPTHRSLLSELLSRAASLPVREIADQTVAEANRIYVIPPNSDLTISQGVLRLTPRDKAAGPARSIDHFLKSLAADQGERAIGVILSGAGSDGAQGLKAIKEAGGLTFAQDDVTSKYDSMPRSAIGTGCVDFVLAPDRIAAELARAATKPGRTRRRAAANVRDRRGRVTRQKGPLAGTTASAKWPTEPQDSDLRRIFTLLRTRTALDFSLYRPNTIKRRLQRRLTLHKLTSLSSYYRLLRESPAEVEALYQDWLIGVTSFFRNPTVFDTLKKKVFPRLVKQRGDAETLRFWIAGCSSGQEAYSYAMAFAEFCEKASLTVPIQIFATDVNATVLEQARSGRYTKAQLEGLTAARIQRFFRAEHEAYRIEKSIRDMVIFAQQNLLTDPPFTRVDLISCRNMLIYIEPALQQKILPVFHYALRPGGYLVLGTSESVGNLTNLFAVGEKAKKIYVKSSAVTRLKPERLPVPATLRPVRPVPPAPREPDGPATDAYREADRIMLSRFGPAGVLVNSEGEILQFRGRIQPFLEIPSGRATLNLFKLARGGLTLALQKGLQRARTENRPIRERAVSFEGPQHTINIEIIPLKGHSVPCFLVLLEKAVAPVRPAAVKVERSRASRDETRRFGELKREYAETRQHLEHLREQHETTVEELQASNEEVQSSNEELQSLNEELETSNEELESANEELTTLNEELATRNAELRASEQRLREQAQLVELAPLLVRSPKDRIIFWNRGAEVLYGYSREEALGQTSHLLLGAQYSEPTDRIQALLLQQGRWEGEVRHRRKDGALLWVSALWVANLDEQNRLQSVLEINTDITARRQAEESLRQAQELNQRVLDSSADCILVLDLAGRLQFLNQAAERAFDRGEIKARLGNHWRALWSAESTEAAEAAHRSALTGATGRFQGVVQSTEGTVRWWDVVLQPILDGAGLPEQLLAVCRDVTDQKQAEMVVVEEARLAAFRADVALEVARGGELLPILQQLVQIVQRYTEATHVRIWLVRGDPSQLQLLASVGPTTPLDQTSGRSGASGFRIATIAARQRPHITADLTNEPDLVDPEWARREKVTAFAGYPLIYETRVLGVIGLLARRAFDPRLLRELALLTDALALLIQRKQADDERNQLLQQAMHARNEAIAASRAKDEFLAALSHELRTPLNPVLLLASDGAENSDLPEPVRATFETIRNNVLLEAKLIDDLLDLTRIAHGKLALDLQLVDVNRIVADAARIVFSSLDPSARSLVLQLEAEPALIAGDAVRLQQVFWNLLSNAVKFTPHGGRITVRTAILRQQRVLVQIVDSGIGLRQEDLDQIFDVFSQVERRQGGLGLGLAISKQLLERHQGSIRALSDGPGKGSTFEVELPLATAAPENGDRTGGRRLPAHSPRRRAKMRGRAPERLLLVEDHVSTRNALRGLLVKRGFDVTTASSIAEARLRLESRRFDLLISDLGLPDGDGYQFLQEVRKREPELVAIALSGYGTEEDRRRSRHAGFAHHLTKPVSMDALDRVIEELWVRDAPDASRPALTPPDGTRS